ncbi:MAG: hypothetical protein HC848_03105 [Limnobacter sp.]|nr:hypothetical protein [Limnobacter sp.]
MLLFLACVLAACSPNSTLTEENLLKGARAETYELSHGALCARLPTLEAIDMYSRGLIPKNSAVGKTVHAWDMSGLLNIFRANDGRWIVLPSEGLKKLRGVHFRQRPNGENDALCFGKLWVEGLISYEKDQPMGFADAVTARFRVGLKDPHMLRYFRDLKVEPFNPNIFALSTGVAFAGDLLPSFAIDMALKPNGIWLVLGQVPRWQNNPFKLCLGTPYPGLS